MLIGQWLVGPDRTVPIHHSLAPAVRSSPQPQAGFGILIVERSIEELPADNGVMRVWCSFVWENPPPTIGPQKPPL